MSMRKVELVEPTHPQAGEPMKTVEEAAEFLKESARSSANLAHFKSLWAQINPKAGKDNAVQDKRKMFRELATRLADGRLRLREERALFGHVMTAAEATEGFSEPRPTWSPSSQFRIRERRDPSPPPLQEPPMNVDQQIQALLQAANSGAPFCERCRESGPQPEE